MTRRTTQNDTDAPCHDSFLDIVANIVGILIILVMVAGLRARHAAVEAASVGNDFQVETSGLEQRRATAHSIRREILETAARVQDVARLRIAEQRHRDTLATAVAAWEAKIRSRRDQLDTESRELHDLDMAVADARVQLAQLDRDRERVEATKVRPVSIESYPTPLGKSVDGKEVHFQIRAGRVVPIPLDDLLSRFKTQARQEAYQLLRHPELSGTVGPVGGFRLRYTLRRVVVTTEEAMASGRAGSYARLTQWTLLPDSNRLGESVEAALEGGSRFQQVVGRLDPADTTLTIWTYPDSFSEFRQLKKTLYHRGFAVAARPLPHGVPIAGTPRGSRSSAE